MQTELATNPVSEAPAPGPEVAPTPQTPPELEIPSDQLQPEGQEATQLDDTEEAEYEGKKYKLPRELVPALMRQADYTKKTQETAAEKRANADEKAKIAEDAKAFQEDRQEHVQAYALWQQLEQFKGVNWQQLKDQDFIQYQETVNNFQMLRDAHRDVVARLNAKQQQRKSAAEAHSATLRDQTRSQLAREIPNWSPKTEQDLTAYALKNGYKTEEVTAALNSDARPFKFLHKAFLYDQLVEKQRQAAKAQAPAEPVKPVGTGRVPAQGINDGLSTETWMARRNAQVARKA